jgi:hypothetical protein
LDFLSEKKNLSLCQTAVKHYCTGHRFFSFRPRDFSFSG